MACPQLVQEVLEKNIQEIHVDATFKIVPTIPKHGKTNAECSLHGRELCELLFFNQQLTQLIWYLVLTI